MPMKINTVALIGAGAIGAYFIYGMADVLGENFLVVADGERAKRLQKEGLLINGKTFHPVVKTPAEARGADLLLVCTKGYALTGALDAIKEVVADNTQVLSLLNGIDSEERIGEVIGKEHVLYSVMFINAEHHGKEITFDPEKTIGVRFGEADTEDVTPRMEAIGTLFDETNIHYGFRKDIKTDLWKKYAMNICYNLPQAVLNVNYVAYFKSEHVARLRDKLFEEVAKVGKAEGITVPPLGKTFGNSAPEARFSTLQDLDAQKQTEIDMFLGHLLKLADKHGIAAPYADYTYHAIKALEEKNEGVFSC